MNEEQELLKLKIREESDVNLAISILQGTTPRPDSETQEVIKEDLAYDIDGPMEINHPGIQTGLDLLRVYLAVHDCDTNIKS